MKYRIVWKRKGEEKACGWGESIFNDREMAHQVAENANRKYDHLFHWVECCKAVADKKEDAEGASVVIHISSLWT